MRYAVYFARYCRKLRREVVVAYAGPFTTNTLFRKHAAKRATFHFGTGAMRRGEYFIAIPAGLTQPRTS
jgi:hypothetical protein